jgi:uncharacterized LabA/DUF88 family protein
MYFSNSPGANPRSYMFIDGASFRQCLEEISNIFFDGVVPNVDWNRLRDKHDKVFYYDAIPVQLPDEEISVYLNRIAPKQIELAQIERQSGYHIKTGDAHKRRNRGNEQKMVDVQLAVDALQAASRGLFSRCTLLTGDLDFRPLVSALVDMGVDVTLNYPPGHTNKELIASADTAVPLGITSVQSYLILSDIQREALPHAFSAGQTHDEPPSDSVAIWEDIDHGRCFIVKDNDRMKLVTQRCPYNPKTHRLVLSAKTMMQLRNFAEGHRNLSIPE